MLLASVAVVVTVGVALASAWVVWRPGRSPTAALFAQQGTLTVARRVGVREVSPEESARVQQGDRIRTAVRGRALLVLWPGASAVFEPGSEVLLGQLARSQRGAYTVRLEVNNGETAHRLSGSPLEANRYEVLTPVASVLLSAGHCLVRVSEGGETTVEVQRGSAEVWAQDTTVEVWPGEFTCIAPGRAPSVPRASVARYVFVSERTGRAEVWLLDEEGGEVQLTSHPAADLAPAWSPDGTQIAFESWRDGNSEIYVMGADGSNQRNLSRNEADDCAPVWSPDGQFIAFESLRDGQRELYLMKADGGEPTRLTFGPGLSAAPSWEVGGWEIVFSRIESDSNGDGLVDLRDLAALYSVPAEGGTSRALWYGRLVYNEMVFPWARRAVG